MSERLILEGALQKKKMIRMKLATKAEGLIGAIKASIQHASVVPLRELETNEALELMLNLHDVRQEYLCVCEEIEKIERELR